MKYESVPTILGDILTVKGGKRIPRGKKLVMERTEHPYIRVKNFNSLKILNLDDSFAYLTEDIYSEMSNYIVHKGDVILSIVGTIGRIAIIGDTLDEACLSENCVKFTNLKGVTRDYLYYFLLSPFGQNKIKKGIVGAVQQKLPLKNIRNVTLLLPDLIAQNSITELLSALDNKVVVNNRIINNLEQQAGALFKSWFIDYEPFAGGNFINTELGIIPDGWCAGKLGDMMKILDLKRRPLSSREREHMEKLYPYYGAASLIGYVDNYIFDGIYLLLGEDGSVIDKHGFPILQYVWGKFWVNNHAHVIQGVEGIPVEFLYMLLKHTSVRHLVTGAVQSKINQYNLINLAVIIPRIKVIKKYSDIIAPFFHTMQNLSAQNNKLSIIRDTLLPKLLSNNTELPSS